jgi:SNF2 family DNA or RNA helicase
MTESAKLELAKLGLALHAPLREYQWEGVSFLFANEGALLADEMGLGKTVQASVALTLALRSRELKRALVVAPASLTLNWERELARWAPTLVVRRVQGSEVDRSAFYDLPIEVLVASYEQIRMDALDRIPEGTFDLVVLDEAQRIKNKDSRTALACRLIPRRQSWALTATPLENSKADLESVFAFVKPGLIHRRLSKDELFDRIAPHLMRRRKTEVLGELPPVIIQDLLLELEPHQREAYEEVWFGRTEHLEGQRKPVATTALFGILTRLKQLCNFDPSSGESCKLEALTTLLEQVTGPSDKVIIFSQYVETLEWLSAHIETPSEIFHGGLNAEQRDAIVQRFQEEHGPRVLLMSLRAGGVGLNLQAASVVVLFDRWWNPAVETQAIYRGHRFDRKTPLHVVRFLVQDTVEFLINSVLEAKQALFEEYVEQAPTAEVQPLTRGDLLRILELRPIEIDGTSTGEN